MELEISEYWTTPQDISQRWAALRPEFVLAAREHGGQAMNIVVMANQGLPDGMIAPSFRRVEPKRRETAVSRDWWAVIRRLISVSSGHKKCMIETWVQLDAAGQPISWTAPEVRGRK